MWQWDPATTPYVEVEGDASQPYVPNLDRTAPEGRASASRRGSRPSRSRRTSTRAPVRAERAGLRGRLLRNNVRPEQGGQLRRASPSRGPTSSSSQLAGRRRPGGDGHLRRGRDPDHGRRRPSERDLHGRRQLHLGYIAGEQAGQHGAAQGHCADVWILVGENLGEGEAANQRLVGFKDGVQTVCGPSRPIACQRDPRPASAEQALTKATDWLTAQPAGRLHRGDVDRRRPQRRHRQGRSPRAAARASRSGQGCDTSASRRPRRRRSRRTSSWAAWPSSPSATPTTRVDRGRRPRGQAGAPGGPHRARVPRPHDHRDRLSLPPAPHPTSGPTAARRLRSSSCRGSPTFGPWSRCAAWTSTSAPPRRSASSATTGPASRPWSRSCPGVYPPSGGEIRLDGEPVSFRARSTPAAAASR